MFGLSDKGFKRKRYTDLLESMEKNARDLFGENVNLSERSPMGLFIKVIAFPLSVLWELAEKVYYSAFIDSAEGVSIDRVAKNLAITRRPAMESVGEITITGLPDISIPKGFRVATKDGIEFDTVEAALTNENGIAIAKIMSVEKGIHTNVSAESITIIVNPISGIDTVTNPARTEHGSDREGDLEFKARYDRSLSTGGSSTRESIEAALLELRGVTDATVKGNEFNYEKDGLPPNSIAPYVYGGEDDEIAATILKGKAFGIRSFGNIIKTVKDSRGNEHTIGFSRPTPVDIYVRVQLITNGFFDPKSRQAIKRAIIEYIGGYDQDGTYYKGLGVGQSVIHTRIVGYGHMIGCDYIQGVEDILVELSKDGVHWERNNMTVENLEVPETDHTKVFVS